MTSSGMSAISTTLLTLLRPGDRLIIQRELYGGTHTLVHEDLKEMGIEADVIDASGDPASWQALLTPSTKVRSHVWRICTLVLQLHVLAQLHVMARLACACLQRQLRTSAWHSAWLCL